MIFLKYKDLAHTNTILFLSSLCSSELCNFETKLQKLKLETKRTNSKASQILAGSCFQTALHFLKVLGRLYCSEKIIVPHLKDSCSSPIPVLHLSLKNRRSEKKSPGLINLQFYSHTHVERSEIGINCMNPWMQPSYSSGCSWVCNSVANISLNTLGLLIQIEYHLNAEPKCCHSACSTLYAHIMLWLLSA